MIAVVIVGLLTAIALPRSRDAMIAADVRSARAALVNTYGQARIIAIQTRRSATMHFDAGRMWITVDAAGGGVDTVGSVNDLSAAYGVTVAAAGDITIQPTGLVNASVPISIQISKYGKADTLVISGYGRVQ